MQPYHPRHASHVVLKQEVGQKTYVLCRVHANEAERRDALRSAAWLACLQHGTM
jgi:hypothetical protein